MLDTKLDRFLTKYQYPQSQFSMSNVTLGDFRNISTLQFLEFWYQNGLDTLFLVAKPIEVISSFISKLMKKILDGGAVEISKNQNISATCTLPRDYWVWKELARPKKFRFGSLLR